LLILLAGAACAAEPPATVTIAPMVSAPPLRGTVTVVTADGQFYTNFGVTERLRPGAELLLCRGGEVLARGGVLKVNLLDSIAELLPGFAAVIPMAGDTVWVQYNPPPGEKQHGRPPKLPDIEPDMGFGSIDGIYAVAALIGAVLLAAK
jgi:hypothetical protein